MQHDYGVLSAVLKRRLATVKSLKTDVTGVRPSLAFPSDEGR